MPPIASEFIIYISTHEEKPCPMEACDFWLGRGFEESCNHLLRDHGLPCLHIGQETRRDNSGNPSHRTVAVFGK
jgi:hypothetical protein